MYIKRFINGVYVTPKYWLIATNKFTLENLISPVWILTHEKEDFIDIGVSCLVKNIFD